MKEEIIILGCGGHGKVLLDLIGVLGKYKVVGILDPSSQKGATVLGHPVLGDDELLPELFNQKVRSVCVGVGSIGDNMLRKSLFEKARQAGFDIPSLVHPSAICAKDAQIGMGAQVMAGAIIQTGSFIGDNTIVNTGAKLDHDCRIGSHVHIAPGVTMSGGCIVDNETFVGAGAVIIQKIHIGQRAIVGAGAVVVCDVSAGVLVKGVPAR